MRPRHQTAENDDDPDMPPREGDECFNEAAASNRGKRSGFEGGGLGVKGGFNEAAASNRGKRVVENHHNPLISLLQ